MYANPLTLFPEAGEQEQGALFPNGGDTLPYLWAHVLSVRARIRSHVEGEWSHGGGGFFASGFGSQHSAATIARDRAGTAPLC